MVRLKFAAFAVAVLAVWVWHLYALAPGLTERAKAAASIQASRAPSIVAVKIDERRREFHRAALKVSGAPGALTALKNRSEPPTAEKLTPVIAAAREEIPEIYRGALVVALTNEHGSVYARGSGNPITDLKDLNVASLGQAGAEGLWQEAFGSTHLFFSFPIAGFDRNELKPLGTLILGAPLPLEGLLDAASTEAGLGAIALLKGGKVISIAGPHKPSAGGVDNALGPGKADVVIRGAATEMAFLHFPLGTSGDPFGGKAPLWVGSRQALRGTPYEVIGYADMHPVMEPLAAYQRVTVLLFFVLLGLSVAMGLFIEEKRDRILSRRALQEEGGQRGRQPDPARPAGQSPGAFQGMASLRSLAGEPPPVPEDTDAYPAAPLDEPSHARPHLDDSFGYNAPEPSPNSSNGVGGYGEDHQPTTVYSSPNVPDDAFAMAGQSEVRTASGTDAEAFPDATRIQQIPEELLRASARPETEPVAPPEPLPRAAPPGESPNDEQHFREVFREFLATKEKCAEAADGLTYDRFAQKLRKNRDVLVEKYSCRTVRFQVYVKDGKAALKATPVKS
jgi:hypothetical protein